MVPSYEPPNLTTLNTESLNRFLEQCQHEGLDDRRILHQISEDIKYLITTKLKAIYAQVTLWHKTMIGKIKYQS